MIFLIFQSKIPVITLKRVSRGRLLVLLTWIKKLQSTIWIWIKSLVRLKDDLLRVINNDDGVNIVPKDGQGSGNGVHAMQHLNPFSSSYPSQPFSIGCKRQSLIAFWAGLISKFLSTHMDSFHLLEGYATSVLEEMEHLEVIDLAHLKIMMGEVFKSAIDYSNWLMSFFSHTRKLEKKAITLATLIMEHDKEAQSLKAIERQIGQLEVCLAQLKALRSSLVGEKFHREATILSLEEEIIGIKDGLAWDGQSQNMLQQMNERLEASLRALFRLELFY